MMIDGTRASDRSTELVLAYYAAFNRGDWDAMLALLDEQVVHEANQGGRRLGRAAFAEFMAEMSRCYREQLREVVVLASWDGRRASAEYVVEGEYLASQAGLPEARGQRYRLPGGAFFELAGERIVRITNYYNLQDWLRQVGADPR